MTGGEQLVEYERIIDQFSMRESMRCFSLSSSTICMQYAWFGPQRHWPKILLKSSSVACFRSSLVLQHMLSLTRLCLRGRRLRFTSKCFINIRPKTTLGLKHRYPFNYFQMIKLPHSPSLSPFWSVWRWNYRSHREIRVTFWKSQSFNIWRRILMLFMPIFHSSGCFASIKYKKRVVF